jgi:hypothetical protein
LRAGQGRTAGCAISILENIDLNDPIDLAHAVFICSGISYAFRGEGGHLAYKSGDLIWRENELGKKCADLKLHFFKQHGRSVRGKHYRQESRSVVCLNPKNPRNP